MRNTIFLSILTIIGVYLLKKGIEAGEKAGDTLNFAESLKKGFQITMQQFASSQQPEVKSILQDDPGYVDDKPGNPEMVNFTNQLSNFPGARLKRQRGVFHAPTIYRSN